MLNYVTALLHTKTIIDLSVVIAKEQPREEARVRGGSLIEPCAIVPGAEKVLNGCSIE